MDIKYTPLNGFKFINLTEKEHFVSDIDNVNIYNGLMVALPRNEILFKCIRRIVKNVANKFYGNTPLSPTGPEMLGSVRANNNFILNIDLNHYEGGGYIIYKNIFVISTEYPEYNHERTTAYNNNNTKRYNILWENKNIYI